MNRSILLCILSGLFVGACGQKGPPMAPIVYVPRPVSDLSAKRVEGDIVLQFGVPTANTDRSSPADLDRLEVYAHTGPLPAAADFLKFGTLVQAIEVKQPATEEQRAEDKETSATGPAAPNQGAEAPAKVDAALVEQGWATSVRETLTEQHMEIGPMPPTRALLPAATALQVETLETPGTVNFPAPVWRYYTVVGVSRSRNRRGPYAGPIRVPLVAPLQPPEKVDTTYTAEAISLSWPGQSEDTELPAAPAPAADAPADTPASPDAAPADATALDPVSQETPGTYELYADIETPGTEDAHVASAAPARRPVAAPAPAPRFGYNVYEAASASAPSAETDKPAAPPAPIAPTAPVIPLNKALLTTPAFADARVEFGTERCYVVRRVEVVASVAIESAASAPVCVTPVDRFPPAAPKTLASVASGTAVSLIWEANTEADLGGYLILRGEAPGDKLASLTPGPIGDASYLDTSARRSRTYVYEVVAVDKAGNQSGPSNRVEVNIQ